MKSDLAVELSRRWFEDRNVLGRENAADLLEKIAIAYNDQGIEWKECKDFLRSQHCLKDWETRIKIEARRLKNIASIGGDPSSDDLRVRKIWKDAPVSPDAIVPPGWGISAEDKEDAIFKVVTKKVDGEYVEKRLKVSHDPVIITKRILDEDRTWRVELAWKTDDRWQRASYPRDAILDGRSLVKASARGVPVSSVSAAALVEYLQAYEHHNMKVAARGYSTSSMGWKGERGDLTHDGFMCGQRQIGGNGRAFEVVTLGDGDDEDVESISVNGTFEAWKAVMAKVDCWPVIKLFTYAALAPALLLPLRAPNMIIELSGPTTRGKTTAMKIAQSCWRSGDFPIQTWNNTVVGFEAKAHVNTDMPLFIDDTKTAIEQGKGVQIAKVIYQFIAGRGRGRGSRDGGQRQTPTWRSIMLSTGEVPASSLAKAEGAATRVLSLWTVPTGSTSSKSADKIEEIESAIADSYGHAGPCFVKWLCEHRDEWNDLREIYDETATKVRDKYKSPAASRIAKVIAIIDVAAEVAKRCECVPWKYVSCLDDPALATVIDQAIVHATQASTLAQDAWRDLCSYASARRDQWLEWGEPEERKRSPPGGWLGWQGYTRDFKIEYAWEPAQIKRAIKEIGHGERTDEIMRIWREIGILDAEDNRFSKNLRCGRKVDVNGITQSELHRVTLIHTDEKAWIADSSDDTHGEDDDESEPYQPDNEIPF